MKLRKLGGGGGLMFVPALAENRHPLAQGFPGQGFLVCAVFGKSRVFWESFGTTALNSVPYIAAGDFFPVSKPWPNPLDPHHFTVEVLVVSHA